MLYSHKTVNGFDPDLGDGSDACETLHVIVLPFNVLLTARR